MSEYKWSFPPTSGGDTYGYKNPDLEHFKKNDPFVSLTREIIQNSLDAKNPKSSKPVRIEFEVVRQATKSFPDYKRFIKILELCRVENDEKNKEAHNFYQNAFKLFDNPHLKILKISDFNTTGLTPKTWNNLVKSSGRSENKSATAGGSYGFGKSAPYASSKLRTIFYSSLDESGNYLFQGKSLLQTHKDIDTNQDTQRNGFYGLSDEELSPVSDLNQIDKEYAFYKRDDVGTSIFIMGLIDDDNWYDNIAISVLTNFFPAIDQEKLTVTILPEKKEAIYIKKHGLEKSIQQFTNTEVYKPSYYLQEFFDAYKSSQQVDSNHAITTTNGIRDLGDVKVTTFQKKGLPKREIYFRSNGMIIQKRRHQSIECISVVEIVGEKLNEYLRLIENPTHDAWEPSRSTENPTEAQEIIDLIRKIAKEGREAILEIESQTELDFEGMEKYLPDDPDLIKAQHEEEDVKEDISKPKPIKMIEKKTKKFADKNPVKKPTGDDEGGGSIGDNPGSGKKGSKKGDTSPEGPGGGDEGPNEKNKFETYRIKKIRVFSEQRGQYQIILLSEEDKRIYLKLTVNTEDGDYDIPIQSANLNGNNLDLDIDNRIGPIDLKSNEQTKIEVALQDTEDYMLGVRTYESK